jgi:hypothetical protein
MLKDNRFIRSNFGANLDGERGDHFRRRGGGGMLGGACSPGLRSRNRNRSNRIHLGSPEPEQEPYSEYGNGSMYKKMKLTTQKMYK